MKGLLLCRAALAAVSGCVLLGGCSLVGTWCTVEVRPREADFPMAAVTLARDGTYCAAQTTDGLTRMSAGTYRWTGLALTLERERGAAQTFAGLLRLDGKLVLTQRNETGKTTAVLEKQKE